MASQTQVYQVPVIFPDILPAEAILQTLDALDYLDSVVNDVFTKIANRVDQNRKKVEHLGQRLAIVEKDTQSIAGSKKATLVKSAAKYPAPKLLDSYVPLYHDVPVHVPDRNEYDLPEKMPQQAAHISDSMVEVVAMLDSAGKSKLKIAMDGMGRLPDNLLSASSLLLFNTNENPYKNYAHLDNLLGVEGKDRPSRQKRIGAQPRTFIDGDSLTGGAALNFNYKPALGNIPVMELPATLPGLGDVADINLSTMELPPIAPSTDSILNLPDFSGGASATGWNTITSRNAYPGGPGPNSPPPPPPPGTADGAFPPPPPPPPPGAFSEADASSSTFFPPPPPPPPPGAFDASASQFTPSSSSAAPPPPPPPPPAFSSARYTGGDDDDYDETTFSPSASSFPPPPPPAFSSTAPSATDDFDDTAGFEELTSRTQPEPVAPVMDIFAQIRANQKERLRKVDSQPVEQPKAQPPPGDMFGTLLQGLEMRRKAIKEEDSEEETEDDW